MSGGYDAPKYLVKRMLGPVFATFASAFKCTSASVSKLQTAASKQSRVEFFETIKVTGAEMIMRKAPEAITHLTPATAPQLIIMNGTNTVATSGVLGTTILASAIPFGLNTGSKLSVNTGNALNVKFKHISDGTATTQGAVSADIYIEYQSRF